MATFEETFETIPQNYKTSLYYAIGSIRQIKDRIANPSSIFDKNAPRDFVDLPSDQQEVVRVLLLKAIDETFFKRN